MRNKYQRKERKSNHKFEVVGGQELLVRVPLPIAEVWAEMQAQVEELTGQAGLQILRAILENEVTHRVGPPHRPNPTAGCVRWGKQPGYVVFAGQKIPLERPRVRTREGQEVELESYGQLQQDGKLQRAVRERLVAGLSTRNYRRAVESVLEGYGIPPGGDKDDALLASRAGRILTRNRCKPMIRARELLRRRSSHAGPSSIISPPSSGWSSPTAASSRKSAAVGCGVPGATKLRRAAVLPSACLRYGISWQRSC